MAPFRLRKDARKWFKELEKGFDSDAPLFEMFYLCLIAGLATKKKADVSTTDATELVDYFPGEYRARGRVIVATFLARELQALGIEMTEKRALHSSIAQLVDPLSPSHLSEAGVKEMNRYAAGGFDQLTEHFDDPPRAIETFIPLFKQFVEGGAK